MIKIENNPGNNVLKGYSMLLSFAGTFVLQQPQTGCINDLAETDIFKRMPVESKNPGFILASSYLRTICKGVDIDYDMIMSDHKSLFGAKGKSLAPPYESEYLSDDKLLFKEQTSEVSKIYEIYGWRSESADFVPGDHLGIELQFLILLVEKYLEIEDGICKKELIKDLNRYINNHLSPWINEWNQLVQKNASSDFYKGVGHLIVSCIQDISKILNPVLISS
jgi:TorA maturation chaperone TorD